MYKKNQVQVCILLKREFKSLLLPLTREKIKEKNVGCKNYLLMAAPAIDTDRSRKARLQERDGDLKKFPIYHSLRLPKVHKQKVHISKYEPNM